NIISMSLGSLVGFVPLYLVNNYGFTLRYSYWLMILLASIIFVAQIPFYWQMFKYVKEEKRENGLKFNIKSKEVVVKYSIIQVIQMLAFGPFSSMFTFFVNKKFGVESDALGGMQFISYFVQAGSNLLSPKISNHFGSVKTITASLILASPFFALFTIAPSFLWISIIYITRLGVASICNPLLPSLFFKLLYEEESATANSIASMASNGASIFTPRIGAYLVDSVSINAPAILAALMYPIYGATFYYFFKNLKPPNIEVAQEVTKQN
ncbi:MFS transporter, partial [Candidatus Bathyarchaeota archaeon]|nr:MFS transporter [Candidatus Bathyarchaeota archaeon]